MPSSLMDVAGPARSAAANGANALFRNAARGAEPSQRFDKVLDQRKQSAEPADSAQAESVDEAEKPEKPRDSKASSKADRKRGSHVEDDPHDETPVDAVDAEETAPVDEAPAADSENASEDTEESTENAAAPKDAVETDDQEVNPTLMQQAFATNGTQMQTVEGEASGDAAADDAMAASDDLSVTGATAQVTSADPTATAKGTASDVDAQATAETGKSAEAPKRHEGLKKGEKPDETNVDDTKIVDVKPDATKSAAHASAKHEATVDPSQLAPQPTQTKSETPTVAPPPQVQSTPEQQFAEDNHDTIVTSIRGELAKGGSVQLRLDPPSLGKINVQVTIDDAGVMSASMQTNNEEATRLLSHSLQQLKSSLESAGVSVDRIQVRQAPPSESSQSQQQSQGDSERQRGYEDQSARQEQQRKEMLQRMWRKLGMGVDDLDLVA